MGKVLAGTRGQRPGERHARHLHDRQRPLAQLRRSRRLGRARSARARGPAGKGACACRASCAGRVRFRPAPTSDAMLMTIDLLPTIARLVGAELPKHAIDGLDVWPLLAGQPGATNPHDAYLYYYEQNQLQAVVSGDGRWKLQLPHTYRSLAGTSRRPRRHPGKVSADQDRPARALRPGERSGRDNRRRRAAARRRQAGCSPSPKRSRGELGDSLTKRQGREFARQGTTRMIECTR